MYTGLLLFIWSGKVFGKEGVKEKSGHKLFGREAKEKLS